MASWRNEYISALEQRDLQEKASLNFYESYTKLADRTAALDRAQTLASTAVYPRDVSGSGRTPSPAHREALANLRQDLLEAQRTKVEQQSRLKSVTEELEKLRLKSKADSKRINDLSMEKVGLTRGMKDRDEELRGKAKLLEDVHNETVSLTLELNMAEERLERLREENKELVDRWMARMSKEADAMNDASRYS